MMMRSLVVGRGRDRSKADKPEDSSTKTEREMKRISSYLIVADFGEKKGRRETQKKKTYSGRRWRNQNPNNFPVSLTISFSFICTQACYSNQIKNKKQKKKKDSKKNPSCKYIACYLTKIVKVMLDNWKVFCKHRRLLQWNKEQNLFRRKFSHYMSFFE
jgi:hypothetical protein